MEKLKYLFIFIFLFANLLQAQTDSLKQFGAEIFNDEYKFAVKLTPDASGQLINYAIIRFYSDSTREIVFLTKTDFMRQICGKQKSPANTKKLNLLQKNNIPDSTVIDNLWKLRYSDYPYSDAKGMPVQEKGWANNPDFDFLPSNQQFKLLKEFGICRINDFIIGDKLMKLFKAMADDKWLTTYKSKGN